MTTDRREALKARVLTSFKAAFGEAPALLIAAPGRVNLIGEHTDYNDGFVLPCAIDYETLIAISPAPGSDITAIAADYDNAADQFAAVGPFATQPAEWKNHLRGVTASFAARDHSLSGANIAIAGNVPQGAGLSSSASFSVGLAKALATLNGLNQITATELALIAQQSENDFVGTACGNMDQLASARSTAGHAMLLDCRSLDIAPVAIPDDIAVLVIHSGIKRGLVDSAYNERRQQCEQAAAHYGVVALRDLDRSRLEAGRDTLDSTSFRRARHVVSENDRTIRAAKALQQNDIPQLSQLMAESHQSMRDDFAITTPAIDNLVAIIANVLGDTGGVRMTGGGFGGCVVALMQKHQCEAVQQAVHRDYRDPQGNPPAMFLCIPSAGASIIDA